MSKPEKTNLMPQNDKLILAKSAAAILSQNNGGSLSTFSIKHPGFPFASVTNYSISPTGEPVFFLSDMARHSKNIKSNPNASLLVVASSNEQSGPLAAGRITLLGSIKPVESDDIVKTKESYLAANPEATKWVTFGDFRFYKMEIIDAYHVAGFGAMGWIPPGELSEAINPNPNQSNQ